MKYNGNQNQIESFINKVIIAGSRNFNDVPLFVSKMNELIDKFKLNKDNTIFITGMASSGADALIVDYCKHSGWQWLEVPAEWDNLVKQPVHIKVNRSGKQYNSLAGMNRNNLMVSLCNKAAFFWDGVTTGTKHCITSVQRKDIDHLIYIVKGKKRNVYHETSC